MKRVLSGFLALLVAVSAAVVLAVPGYAEGEETVNKTSLQISPSVAAVMLDPGMVLVGDMEECPTEFLGGCFVRVTNNGSSALTYRLFAAPYSVQGEENNLSFSEDAMTTRTQLARWIKVQNADGEYVSEAQYRIQPGESQTVGYKISIPDDIPAGSQYAVIFAQIMGSGEGAGVEAVGQVGVVISGRSTSADTREAAEIKEYDFMRFALSGPLTANATVANTGNTDFAIKYSYVAKTFFGKEIYKDEGMTPAYPETEYHINTSWEEGVPFAGIFQVTFSLMAGNEERTETHVVMIMPIIIMILVILLLTVIVVWTIIIIRKRKEHKTRKLV